MSSNNYMSEMFRIITGALRLDINKVHNYAAFLADKLESDGDEGTAKRLRKLLDETDNQLHPAKVGTRTPPVDGETRFPLLEEVNILSEPEPPIILTRDQNDIVNEFISVAKAQAQYEIHGISTPISMILYGPPGCGKSRLARHVTRELALKLFIVRLDGLISSYLGSTAKNIRAIFEFAASTPGILFLDEFDAIAKLRDDTQEIGELKRVVNSFLQNLDMLGSQSVVIAATNHHNLLDSAVWRRFSYKLELPYPSVEIRIRLWEQFLASPIFKPIELKILADLSEGFSGGDIREVCLRLRRKNLITKEKISISDVLIGLKQLLVNTGEKGEYLHELKDRSEKMTVHCLRQRNPKLYSYAHLASLLGVSKATVHRMAKEGES